MTRTTTLGGTASDIVVGKVAHGLMLMTCQDPVPDEQCFEAIKAGIDTLPHGCKNVTGCSWRHSLLYTGEFYGHNLSTTNLEMIARFFEKYPSYADKAFLSVKVSIAGNVSVVWRSWLQTSYHPDCSPANLRRSVETINEKLRGTKRLDLFESARVDPNSALAELKNEGKLDHIGIFHPISVVEIEISPWSYEEETKNVIATANELGIAVAGYSPLGRGFLTGQIKRFEDLPDDAMRHNFTIVDALSEIAKKKNVTPAQLSIAWVGALGPHVIPLPGSSHAKRTLENCAGGDIELTQEELDEINRVIRHCGYPGGRYATAATLWG
ncbi:aldo/keto reductase [Pisolithus microcarpus]|nr:aldo/keto reductase [Pisolithus microcarpus]